MALSRIQFENNILILVKDDYINDKSDVYTKNIVYKKIFTSIINFIWGFCNKKEKNYQEK